MPGARGQGGRRILLAMGCAGVLAGAALAGCFSERTGTGPAQGTCRVLVDDPIPGSTIVFIQEFTFLPAEVRIRPGERVTWVNCEEQELAHTSTADQGQWSSPLLAPGDAFTQAFPTAGTFPYHCEPHPFMTARVIVE